MDQICDQKKPEEVCDWSKTCRRPGRRTGLGPVMRQVALVELDLYCTWTVQGFLRLTELVISASTVSLLCVSASTVQILTIILYKRPRRVYEGLYDSQQVTHQYISALVTQLGSFPRHLTLSHMNAVRRLIFLHFESAKLHNAAETYHARCAQIWGTAGHAPFFRWERSVNCPSSTSSWRIIVFCLHC